MTVEMNDKISKLHHVELVVEKWPYLENGCAIKENYIICRKFEAAQKYILNH